MIGKRSALLLLISLCAAHNAQAADGAGDPIRQASGGLGGYISMSMPKPPADHRSGVSFYASVWRLVDAPLSSFQIGLPSTWIVPDNIDFKEPLCPPGTFARDHWPERGPTYRDVFQTIEGGLGYWGSTQFGSAVPKYRINGTPDGYNHEISSPGWGFGRPAALKGSQMGLAQLSNRLLLPPDGLTFQHDADGQLLGNAWMALPLSPATQGPDAPTGDQSWTLFLNASNFKGPVAFWLPAVWSKISEHYPTDNGRGLDARPALMEGGAMEVNTVPCFESADAKGVTYARIPRLRFPVDDKGRTILMQDVKMYSEQALYGPMKNWFGGKGNLTGEFDPRAAWAPVCSTGALHLKQGARHFALAGLDAVVKTRVFGGGEGYAFGLEWAADHRDGVFPEYYREADGKRVAIAASQVPAETRLAAQRFAPAGAGRAYASPYPADTCWTQPGPKLGPFTAGLADGSTVTYCWYRFVDQPALQQLHLSDDEKLRWQSVAERIQAHWPIDRDYMPPPSSGALAAFDGAQIVTPPPGLEIGYVPIVTRQAKN